MSKSTAEELANHVKSDMDIEEIVEKFQHDLQELDYGNRVAAIQKAVEHLNQGCTVNYVADGLREWYGIVMAPNDLKSLLLQSEDLLPEEKRKENVDKNLLTDEKPDDGKKIDLAYLQHKYKKGYHYIDDLYRKNIPSYSGSDLCEALYFQAVCNLCKDRSEIDEYFENLKREREAAEKKNKQLNNLHLQKETHIPRVSFPISPKIAPKPLKISSKPINIALKSFCSRNICRSHLLPLP